MNTASGRGSSLAWLFFEKHPDADSEKPPRAVCTICRASLSLGSQKARSQSTTSLLGHLRAKHPEEIADAEKKQTQQNQNRLRQVSLNEADIWAGKWSINSEKAVAVHKYIFDTILADLQPMSVVEDEGFRRLIHGAWPKYEIPGRKFFREKLPSVYGAVRDKVLERLPSDGYLSFGTDGWTSTNGEHSFQSLTAHWLDENFQLQSAVLGVDEITGRHTADNLLTLFCSMLLSWNITDDRVHTVVTDSGSNIVKAMKDGKFSNNRCACHTLHLIVKKGEKALTEFTEVAGKVSRKVEHFRRSSVAKQEFRECQNRAGVPEHKLIQQVSTRWNSLYQMIDRFVEQKLAIGDYANRHDSFENLTKAEWEMLEAVRFLLGPFLTATEKFSKKDCSVAEVIPMLKWLRTRISSSPDGVLKPMKDEMLLWLNKPQLPYFGGAEQNEVYQCATVLDPRFKTSFFSTSSCKDQAVLMLRERMNEPTRRDNTDDDDDPIAMKVPRTESTDAIPQCNLDDVAELPDSQPSSSPGVDELTLYLCESKLNCNADPYEWWRKNASRFPRLAQLARQYLSARASSVDEERLFSSTGRLLEAKRSRLLAKNASMMAFCYFNLPDISYDYQWPK